MSDTSLSARGNEASKTAAGDNLTWEVISNLYEPATNPNGYVSLGVAENALMHSELAHFLNSKQLVEEKSFTYGDGPSGSKPVRIAIANFLNTQFRPVKGVEADHVMVTNGLSSALEHLSWALTNPSDGILLGRPYYRSFLADLTLRTGAKVVPVSFGSIDPFSPSCVSQYEAALLEAERSGTKIKALLLCHPHNPLGRIYPRDSIIELMKLCQKYGIHFISDEVYALSVWGKHITDASLAPDAVPFESVLSFNTEGVIDPGLVHVLWGLSKDFGANGIRLGALISQANPRLLAAVRSCGIYSSPSSLAESATVQILKDTEFVESYIATNQKRLAEHYSFAVGLLKRHDIEFRIGAGAAFFLWVNLGRTYLKKHDGKVDVEDLTEVVFEKLMERNVYVVRGDAAGSEEPGWYRLVFSQPKELLEEGIRRIAEALE